MDSELIEFIEACDKLIKALPVETKPSSCLSSSLWEALRLAERQLCGDKFESRWDNG